MGVFVGRPRGIETGGSGLRAGGLFAAPVVDAGAEAVDFGEADTDTDCALSESESVFSFCSPAASLFNIFFMSIHVRRPLQAGSPAPEHVILACYS
jgi:hypothetical protein